MITEEAEKKLKTILDEEFVERIYRIQREFSTLQDWDIRVGYSNLNRNIDSPVRKFHFLRLHVEGKLNEIIKETWKSQ